MYQSIDLKKYDTLIFDLGGVLLNINYHKTTDEFKKLGVVEFDKLYTQLNQHHIFDGFERGEISAVNFRTQIVEESGIDISQEPFDKAWNAMLLDFPEERMNLLEQLRNTHRIFLLSNTNAPHIIAFNRYMKQIGLYDRFINVFEKRYYSFEVGMRKPEKRIFDLVVDENKLDKAKTLFIDDSPQHVEGAIKTGLHAVYLEPGKTIIDILG